MLKSCLTDWNFKKLQFPIPNKMFSMRTSSGVNYNVYHSPILAFQELTDIFAKLVLNARDLLKELSRRDLMKF